MNTKTNNDRAAFLTTMVAELAESIVDHWIETGDEPNQDDALEAISEGIDSMLFDLAVEVLDRSQAEIKRLQQRRAKRAAAYGTLAARKADLEAAQAALAAAEAAVAYDDVACNGEDCESCRRDEG